MAKYIITHSCGHKNQVALTGPNKDREWRIERMEAEDCLDCLNAAAAKKNAEAGLPALSGTEKQIAWAEQIRTAVLSTVSREKEAFLVTQKMLAAKDAAEGPRVPHEVTFLGRKMMSPGGFRAMDGFERRAEMAESEIKGKTSASWWIENRSGVKFAEIAEKINLVEVAAEADVPAEIVNEAKAEATVRPEKCRTENVCEIRIKTDVLELDFAEKREDFRELVKFKHQFAWNGNCWSRKVGEYPGLENKAVEMGVVILAAGIPVRVFNDEVRDRIAAGQYEPENHKKCALILSGENKGKLVLCWRRLDRDFYDAAKRVHGAKWSKKDGGMTVPAENWAEAFDFARLNGFRITKTAEAAAEAAETAKLAAVVTKPKIKTVMYQGAAGRQNLDPAKVDGEVADELRD